MAQKASGLNPQPPFVDHRVHAAIGGKIIAPETMRLFGKVEIPLDAFIAALKMDED